MSALVGELLVVDLGALPYAEALALQRDVARRRISGEIDEDVLLLVEHPPVVTLGRMAKSANLMVSPEYLASHGVELFEVERGGDVTFHGPGQLVGYPIFDLQRHRKDLHWYLRQVEEALIQAVSEFGIVASRVEKFTGVWVGGSGTGGRPRSAGRWESGIGCCAPDAATSPSSRVPGAGYQLPGPGALPARQPRKLASIGVHARDWVTWHGFALNVNTDLRYFDLIVPCGINGVMMTSVARELDRGSIEMSSAARAVTLAFGAVFGLAPLFVQPADLSAAMAEGGRGGSLTHNTHDEQ